MPASMIIGLMLIGDDKLARIPSDDLDPCAILEALEDRDDAEWQSIGYASRAEYIRAHLDGEV